VQHAQKALLDAEGLSAAGLRQIHAIHLARHSSPDGGDRDRSLRATALAYKYLRPPPAPAGTKPLPEQLLDEMTVEELRRFAAWGSGPSASPPALAIRALPTAPPPGAPEMPGARARQVSARQSIGAPGRRVRRPPARATSGSAKRKPTSGRPIPRRVAGPQGHPGRRSGRRRRPQGPSLAVIRRRSAPRASRDAGLHPGVSHPRIKLRAPWRGSRRARLLSPARRRSPGSSPRTSRHSTRCRCRAIGTTAIAAGSALVVSASVGASSLKASDL
jgi:hypothetical protein